MKNVSRKPFYSADGKVGADDRIGVMFVCLGNICRSPMAEFVFADEVKKSGLEHRFRYAIDFKGAAEHKKLHIPVSKEIVITAAALVLYALLLPVLTFFPCTLALNIVLCATFARKENEASEEMKGKLSKKQFLGIVIYSVVLTIVLWLLFTQILKCVLP